MKKDFCLFFGVLFISAGGGFNRLYYAGSSARHIHSHHH